MNSTPTHDRALNPHTAADRAIPEPMNRHTRRVKSANIRRTERREFRREMREQTEQRITR